MDNMFIPYNLVQDKDGSVSPRNFTSHIVPKENETFSQYYKRYWEEVRKLNLKDYEIHKFIPDWQKKELYKVLITKYPTKLKQIEEDWVLDPQLMYEKFFLTLQDAQKWAKNKIKQQSVGYYYSKDNPTRRQYKFTYNIIHGSDNVISEDAVNGKLK